MNDACSVLGLEPASLSEATAKAAYARLVKIHRPDSDPEGFQRVRQAYETVMRHLRDGGTYPGVNAPQPIVVSDQTQTAPKETDILLEAALTELKNAVRTRIRAKVRDALGTFDERARDANLHVSKCGELMLLAFSEHPHLLPELAEDERLLRHVDGGDDGFVCHIIDAWGAKDEWKRLLAFAEKLVRRKTASTTNSGALVAMHTAIRLGPWCPQQADALSKDAYLMLPREGREELSAVAERQITLGRLVQPFPQDQKSAWIAIFFGSSRCIAWREPFYRQLLSSTVSLNGLQWPGFAILQQTLPAHEWDALVSSLRNLVS